MLVLFVLAIFGVIAPDLTFKLTSSSEFVKHKTSVGMALRFFLFKTCLVCLCLTLGRLVAALQTLIVSECFRIVNGIKECLDRSCRCSLLSWNELAFVLLDCFFCFFVLCSSSTRQHFIWPYIRLRSRKSSYRTMPCSTECNDMTCWTWGLLSN